MGATRPRGFAVPAAPQAGLNNHIPRLQTLSPAKKKQAVPAPPRPPSKTFDSRKRGAPLALPSFAKNWLIGRMLRLPQADGHPAKRRSDQG